MDTEIKKLRVDRIENGIIIAFSDDGKKYTMPQTDGNTIEESHIIRATINKYDYIISAEVLNEETITKKNLLIAKLKKLFTK